VIDTIFENARIFDGTGAAPFVTDLAVVDGRIAFIGDARERDAVVRIDCATWDIAPGFIDVHAHTDELWLVEPGARGKVSQGVTTEIAGNCGTSVAPLIGAAREHKAREARAYNIDICWESFDEFFSLVERNGIAINVASLVGLGTTRRAIAGTADRKLENDEILAQARLVREAVEQGALGVSSGLIYEPSRYADLAELAACAQAARAAGAARYVSHLRSESDELLAAVDEALAVGEAAGVAVQCSHHKAAGRRNWGTVHQSLARIDVARGRGLDVGIDAYPYVASWTDLVTILPDAIRSGGEAATLERLRDPKIALGVAFALDLARVPETGGDSWHDIMVTDTGTDRNAHLAGLRMDEIARRWRTTPSRAAIRLLIEEELAVQCAFFTMSEDDVATVLSADFCSIGSDSSARAFDGITARGVPHPRTYGCFPRVFGRFVRQRRTLRVEEAIRRMTSLPARQFGIADRGTIVPGAWADLVVFRADAFVDRATYERPFAAPAGIREVIVNGRAVIAGGEPTGARPGRVLRNGR
jgi:N-acyl-D-amino-acid deacylase